MEKLNKEKNDQKLTKKVFFIKIKIFFIVFQPLKLKNVSLASFFVTGFSLS